MPELIDMLKDFALYISPGTVEIWFDEDKKVYGVWAHEFYEHKDLLECIRLAWNDIFIKKSEGK